MEACVATSSDLSEARALCDAGRLDEAAALCRTVLAQDVGDLAALHLLGVVTLLQKKPAEAVSLLVAVADRYPDPAVLFALSEALQAVGLRDEAIRRWRAVVAEHPGLPDPWLSLGNLLLEEDDLAAAEHCFRSAIAAQPGFIAALNNLGNTLVAQTRLAEAWPCYAAALTLQPDNAHAGFAYALSLLLGGDFAAGWRNFEARREVAALRWNYQRRPTLPQWHPGTALEGRRVLVMAEQGAGDVLQFVRYAPLLAARGAQVVLELPRELHGVLAGLPGIARIVALEDAVADCDIACPLLSLPLYFSTTGETIPHAVPYAQAPADRVVRWRDWLGARRGRRIGLVCSGRPDHPHDRHRSIPLAMLAPILAVPDCTFVLLQQHVRVRDEPVLAATPSLRWPGAALQDFADTAALLGELDLLVTVDSSVAHLAGAMGLPAWLLLPFAPDFRWMLGRDDTPWYLTLRLRRQPAHGDWDTVIAAVARDLHDER
jgi:Flp pilus assembly protein TadD